MWGFSFEHITGHRHPVFLSTSFPSSCWCILLKAFPIKKLVSFSKFRLREPEISIVLSKLTTFLFSLFMWLQCAKLVQNTFTVINHCFYYAANWLDDYLVFLRFSGLELKEGVVSMCGITDEMKAKELIKFSLRAVTQIYFRKLLRYTSITSLYCTTYSTTLNILNFCTTWCENFISWIASNTPASKTEQLCKFLVILGFGISNHL